MELNETALQAIFDKSEFDDFKLLVKEVCQDNEDILGIAITGSLTQKLRLPNEENIKDENKYEQSYQKIENKKRRRLFPSKCSDLDMWICLKDPDNVGDIKKTLTKRGIELLVWLSENMDHHQSYTWIQMKQQAFNCFYKQQYLYSERWKALNSLEPWKASDFKIRLEELMHIEMPNIVSRINTNFDEKVPGEFIEVRAFPQSTYNLRVEEIFINGVKDKTPFPFILDRLLDIERNCFVIYVADNTSHQHIYPFQIDGERLGEDISNFLQEH